MGLEKFKEIRVFLGNREIGDESINIEFIYKHPVLNEIKDFLTKKDPNKKYSRFKNEGFVYNAQNFDDFKTCLKDSDIGSDDFKIILYHEGPIVSHNYKDHQITYIPDNELSHSELIDYAYASYCDLSLSNKQHEEEFKSFKTECDTIIDSKNKDDLIL